MDRVQTYAFGSIVGSTELNDIQDRAVGGEPSAQGNITGCNPGERVVHFELATDLADKTLMIVDDNNWKDYVVAWTLYQKPSGLQTIGAANDYVWGDAVTGGVTSGIAYLGLGADDGTGAQVVNGAPPVPATGVSWAPRIAAGVYIYVDAFDGFKLKVYNNSGGGIRTPYLRVAGTKANKR